MDIACSNAWWEELGRCGFLYMPPDAPTFFQRQQEIAQKLGYREAKMMEKALKQCRSYQVRSGFYRPELTGWKKWGTK